MKNIFIRPETKKTERTTTGRQTSSKTEILFSLLAFTFFSFPAFSFDWPQETTEFSSFFGQLRGSSISSSLIFSEPSEIKSCEPGKAILYIREYQDDTDFFPSALGNALIVSHADNLLTVYGNLEANTTSEEILTKRTIEKGEVIAESGNSAWNEGQGSLEFLVIDTKNNTSINPRLLMPRNVKELPLAITGVLLQNRNGTFYDITKQTYLPSGSYRVYRKRQELAVPYKTRVSINGTLSDEISYDVLRQDGRLLCVSGKRNYPKTALYPNESLQLLGEANFAPGKNLLQASLSDFTGKEVSQNFTVTNY